MRTVPNGGHLEPTDATLVEAAVRELTQETGIGPSQVSVVSATPVYVEHGKVPAPEGRAGAPPPGHRYAFTTARGEVGRIQESEVTGTGWYPLELAERVVGNRIARAVSTPAQASLPGMLDNRDTTPLPGWLNDLANSGLATLTGLARALREDQHAVAQGITTPHNSGVNEGRITDVKLQKRLMAGRAGVSLLRHRVVLIAHLGRRYAN
ncbi:NUDIX domain-containing protein [Streptomyces sp. NPDC047085]|uniref:NUDIX domain-containing protein n=1 Tax=Streptomyces sp. NPDC047085 TaxID=3155140 RepID=UPI0033E633F9